MRQWGDKSEQEKMQTLSAKFQTVSGLLQLEALKRKCQIVSSVSSFLADSAFVMTARLSGCGTAMTYGHESKT